jgi:hypothetical protein
MLTQNDSGQKFRNRAAEPSETSRRQFIAAAAASATAACRGGLFGTAGLKPQRRTLSLANIQTGVFDSTPVLSLVNTDGTVLEIEWRDVPGPVRLKPRNVSRAIAVSHAVSLRQNDYRAALLEDGGVSWWRVSGDKADVTTVDSAKVRSALGGRGIVQIDGEFALLTDGTMEAACLERLNDDKREPPRFMNGDKVLTGIVSSKDGIALTAGGRAWVFYPSLGTAAEMGTKEDPVLDVAYVGNEMAKSTRTPLAALLQSGKLQRVTPPAPQPFARPATFQELPFHPSEPLRKIVWQGGNLAGLSTSGSVWVFPIEYPGKQPLRIAGLNKVVDIAGNPANWTLAALSDDGKVWWIDARSMTPQLTAENVMQPELYSERG